MKKTIFLTYALTVITGLVLLHIIFSLTLSALTHYFYQDTLMNVRRLDSHEIPGMIQAYLTTNIENASKPILLILGTSFSYGHSLTAQHIYSHKLSQKMSDKMILNASVEGESGAGILQRIAYLKHRNYVVDSLFIELNLLNMTSNGGRGLMSLRQQETSKLFIQDIDSYLLFYLLHSHGIQSFFSLDLKRFYATSASKNQAFSHKPLPNDYVQPYNEFNKKKAIYRTFINTLLLDSQAVAKHVFFFIAPVFAKGIEQAKFKVSDIQQEIHDLYQICQHFQQVTCIPTGVENDASLFLDVAHYNETGHHALSERLYAVMKNLHPLKEKFS